MSFNYISESWYGSFPFLSPIFLPANNQILYFHVAYALNRSFFFFKKAISIALFVVEEAIDELVGWFKLKWWHNGSVITHNNTEYSPKVPDWLITAVKCAIQNVWVILRFLKKVFDRKIRMFSLIFCYNQSTKCMLPFNPLDLKCSIRSAMQLNVEYVLRCAWKYGETHT